MNIDPEITKDSFLNVIDQNLMKCSSESSSQLKNLFDNLLQSGKLPDHPLDSNSIKYILHSLSTLDSNNYLKSANVGEREGRIFSKIVQDRCFGFAHGIGRSGDLNEVQPKAIGSSILYQVTNKLAENALKISGISNIDGCHVIPLATGMTLALCMRALAKNRKNAKYVIWTRIDQKSCFKSILSAGFEPIIIQNIIVQDSIQTNLEDVRAAVEKYGADSIVCVMTTTSCFSPRHPDNIFGVGEICKEFKIPHLVNNAYGVQITKLCNILNDALSKTRVDIIVQSTDKNFMVPVGGSIVASPCPGLLKIISSSYAGRASISPIIDLFITLLEMGSLKYLKLLEKRSKNFEKLHQILGEIARDFHLTLLSTPKNQISIAVSLNDLKINTKSTVGRRLFFKSVSGCKVVCKETREICGYSFENWGAHSNDYQHEYLACAASIGMKKADLERFEKRIKSCLQDLINEQKTEKSAI